jgi:hypothetical protein
VLLKFEQDIEAVARGVPTMTRKAAQEG